MIEEFNSQQWQIVFSSPQHPDWFWDPPSILFNGYW